MSLNEDDVKQILKLIDESNFEELNLKTGDLHLIISKRKGGSDPLISLSLPEEHTASPPPENPSADVVALESGAVATGTTQAPVDELLADEGLVPISAPTLGIFYRSPKPGAPAFVEEGDLVEETDTVCIIEVMKLFNHIKAGVRGRVAKICADSGTMVEHSQLLFLIEPDCN